MTLMELTDFQANWIIAHDLQTALMLLPKLQVDVEDPTFSISIQNHRRT